MSIVDERVSLLLAEIHDQPSPEEAFTKWMFVDIFILDGLMIALKKIDQVYQRIENKPTVEIDVKRADEIITFTYQIQD